MLLKNNELSDSIYNAKQLLYLLSMEVESDIQK
jgi:hypothetical protein